MPRQKTPTLTEAELRVMKAVWARGSATVNDVLESLPDDQSFAYNTILTILRILEQKGYLAREKNGRAHIYRPQVSQRQARQKAIRHVVRSLFDNSPELLLLNMIENESLSDEELARLKEMIETKGSVGSEDGDGSVI